MDVEEEEEDDDDLVADDTAIAVAVAVAAVVFALVDVPRFLLVVRLSPCSFSIRLYFSRATFNTCSVSKDLPAPRAPMRRTELFSDSNKVLASSSSS